MQQSGEEPQSLRKLQSFAASRRRRTKLQRHQHDWRVEEEEMRAELRAAEQELRDAVDALVEEASPPARPSHSMRGPLRRRMGQNGSLGQQPTALPRGLGRGNEAPGLSPVREAAGGEDEEAGQGADTVAGASSRAGGGVEGFEEEEEEEDPAASRRAAMLAAARRAAGGGAGTEAPSSSSWGLGDRVRGAVVEADTAQRERRDMRSTMLGHVAGARMLLQQVQQGGAGAASGRLRTHVTELMRSVRAAMDGLGQELAQEAAQVREEAETAARAAREALAEPMELDSAELALLATGGGGRGAESSAGSSWERSSVGSRATRATAAPSVVASVVGGRSAASALSASTLAPQVAAALHSLAVFERSQRQRRSGDGHDASGGGGGGGGGVSYGDDDDAGSVRSDAAEAETTLAGGPLRAGDKSLHGACVDAMHLVGGDAVDDPGLCEQGACWALCPAVPLMPHSPDAHPFLLFPFPPSASRHQERGGDVPGHARSEEGALAPRQERGRVVRGRPRGVPRHLPRPRAAGRAPRRRRAGARPPLPPCNTRTHTHTLTIAVQGRHALIERMCAQLPHVGADDALEHVHWWERVRAAEDKVGEVKRSWMRERVGVLRAWHARLRERAWEQEQERQEQMDREIEAMDRRRKQEELERGREEREAREAEEAARAAEQRAQREAEEARRHAREQARRAADADALRRHQEEQAAKAAEEEARRREEAQREARAAAERARRDATRVQFRHQERETRRAEEEQAKWREEEERRTREQRLRELAAQVPYYDRVQALEPSADRVQSETRASKAAREDAAQRREAWLAMRRAGEHEQYVHAGMSGFSDRSLFRDLRFKLAFALREAGMMDTQYAHQVMLRVTAARAQPGANATSQGPPVG